MSTRPAYTIGSHTLSYGGFLLRELGNGSLTISKTVSGSGFDPAKTFELVVKFSAPVTYNGTTSTTHTLHLAHGQSVTISNIPEFTTYNVTETALTPSEVEAGYSIIGITGGSGTVIEGAYSATASNQFRRKATLTISKSITGSGFDPTKTFEIVVTFGSAILYSVNGTTISTASSTYTANLADGQSVVLGNIPDGTTYSIVESPLSPSEQEAGYTYSGTTNPSGTAVWDGVYSSVVSNSYVRPVGAKTIRIQFEDPTFDPTSLSWTSRVSWQQVSSSPNVWDCTNSGFDWPWSQFGNGWKDMGDFRVLQMNATGVRSLNLMFAQTNILSIDNVTGTSGVTGTSSMFDQCYKLASVSLFDTSNVTDMADMFSQCSSLTTVPLFDTSSVTNMESMFQNSPSLITVPLFDTSKVTKMSFMFANCAALETVPAFNMDKVTNISQMFLLCSSLKSIPAFNPSVVAYCSYTFDGCYKVESGALALYNKLNSQASIPTSHSYTFRNCGRDTTSGAAELALIPSGWK